ncbi:galactokinase [Streptacidiphilus sp. N1-12]|uniref:Galactokinase n=2 Tax=Streptacidiphilus alkalitolerans TaxID=3342712 RepID=A0ABV6VJM6_9ACTN
MTQAEAVRKGFNALYGADPEGVWQAPGRVNVIGEHTDYNDGFMLPIALPHAARVAAARREDGVLRLYSGQYPDAGVTELRLDDLAPRTVDGWAAYPAAVVWALREAGHRVGAADLYLDSDVPTGAGLSSSAALECAVATAYNDLYELGLTPPQLARLCQRAENEFVGVPCGILDQLASACCAEGHALFVDARSLDTRQVPFDLAAHGLVLLVIDTQVKHAHADGAYAERRRGCERAAELLGVRALRDVPEAGLDEALARLPEGGLRSLTRHIVTEDARVERVMALLDAGDLRGIGPILTEGHASMRDDFAISCAETDLAVDTAVAAGALGARMTGGGFGGSIIALADTADADGITAAVTAAFAARGWTEPRAFTAVPGPGARRLA